MLPARHRASILAVVFTLLLAACGQSQSTASAPQTLSVAAKEFAFAPAALSVQAGQPVTISLQNNGAVEHDWSVREIEISGEAKSSGDTPSGHMMGDTGDEPKLHVAAGIGGKGTLIFTPSKPGTYEYYCTIAGHKEAGMVGTLTVKAPWWRGANKPFDQRFIEAMIPHHQGAIAMAKDAQQKAEHPEIKTLAGTIITAQASEIAQMQQGVSNGLASKLIRSP